MLLRYDDIIDRVSDRALWWLDGVPRYCAFDPELVISSEVALVHTECRECRTRYDVAVCPRAPLFANVRDQVAFENQVNVGDPPVACHLLGARCAGGATMTSLQVRILEYWVQDRGTIPHIWRREPSMERPLAHANWASGGDEDQGVWGQILDSDRIEEWTRARQSGDIAAMCGVLQAFDCERPAKVAHILDVERRYRLFKDEISALSIERFGGN
ncbi:hypothetical protein SAMN06295955_107150 [Sphingopyxis indica]|uniref:Uncharacterized protein n=2 Tax=Sphingopyxis indica TaxID=436663 RepID=A0A239IDF8_9SPHN|nr:hypothetical protein SAMN06295955_107150 [Sphingopyxis indica]